MKMEINTSVNFNIVALLKMKLKDHCSTSADKRVNENIMENPVGPPPPRQRPPDLGRRERQPE